MSMVSSSLGLGFFASSPSLIGRKVHTWRAGAWLAGRSHRARAALARLDGFNDGWIEFSDRGKHARRAPTTAEQVVASIVNNG
jgi:hypothetical protein